MPTNDDNPFVVQPLHIRRELDPHRFDDDPEAKRIHEEALRQAAEQLLEKTGGGLMHRHIIDRSVLDQVIAIRKNGVKTTTLRQDLEERDFHRADIVLFNGTRSGKEYCLYVTPTGFIGDLWILDILTNEEYLQVQEIANRMRQNVEEFPPAGKLLRGW